MSDLTQDTAERPASITSTEEPKQHGRARERYERRRARKKNKPAASRVKSTRPRLRQLVPEKSITLPKINTRYLQLVALVAAGGLFMLLIVLGIGMFKNTPTEPDPNALWIGTEWTYAANDDSAIQDLISELKNNQIGVVYAHISELNFDATWTGQPEDTNQFADVEDATLAFAAQMKRFYPELKLFGAINLWPNLDDESYSLDDPEVQASVAAFSTRIINRLGYDGIMINVQPVWNGDESYLDFIRSIRRAIGDDALLAVTVPPDWTPRNADDLPVPLVIAPGTAWDREYKQRVALIGVDQIVVRAFDSYLNATDGFVPDDFAMWVAYQLDAYTEAITLLDDDVEIYIGVSGYGETQPARDTRIESIPAALIGIKRGLDQAGDASSAFVGVALFDSTELETGEWRQFKEQWVDN